MHQRAPRLALLVLPLVLAGCRCLSHRANLLVEPNRDLYTSMQVDTLLVDADERAAVEDLLADQRHGITQWFTKSPARRAQIERQARLESTTLDCADGAHHTAKLRARHMPDERWVIVIVNPPGEVGDWEGQHFWVAQKVTPKQCRTYFRILPSGEVECIDRDQGRELTARVEEHQRGVRGASNARRQR